MGLAVYFFRENRPASTSSPRNSETSRMFWGPYSAATAWVT
jgi:hypothetical protein